MHSVLCFVDDVAKDEMTASAVKKGDAVITTTYIVAGSSETLFGTTWDGTLEANKMAKNADGIWEKSYTNVTSLIASSRPL